MSNASPIRTADFISSLGVNVHVEYTDGKYADPTTTIADLAYLGIDHVRDHTLNPHNQGQANYQKLADAGIKFDLIVTPGSQSLDQALGGLTQFVQANPGSVVSIEGPNEINNHGLSYNSQTDLAAAQMFQTDLYEAAKSSTALSQIPIYNLTGTSVVTSGFDYTNIHSYAHNGDQPLAWLNAALTTQQDKVGAGTVVTEAGYYTLPDDSIGWGGVDQATQAKQTLNLILDAAKLGVPQIYLYELLDAYADPTGTSMNKHFGLFDIDNNPKIAATALHNLTSILADHGTAAANFATDTLNFSMSGMPATGSTLLMQKSSGTFELVVWNEPDIWDEAAHKSIAATASNVAVDLGAVFDTVSIYDPLHGKTPVSVLHNVSTVNLQLGDTPYIIEVGSADVVDSGAQTHVQLAKAGGSTLTALDGLNVLYGDAGNDTFKMLDHATADDRIDGRGGTDTVILDGDYSHQLAFNATTMVNVEKVAVAAGHNYNLATADATVAAGRTLTVDAGALGKANSLTFDGSAETDGTFAIIGGAGDDVLTGGAGGDSFNAGAGADTVRGGGGNDSFNFGAHLDAGDRIDGGAGTDVVYLNGEYATRVALGAATLTGIEKIAFAAGHHYNLATVDQNVAAGQVMRVDGSALTSTDSLVFDGSAERDGRFAFTGGAGNDVLKGGAGTDSFTPGSGNDAVYGGGGNDVLSFGADFGSADIVDGGAGTDTLYLKGDYRAGVSLGHVTNVEEISLRSGHSYTFTATDATVAAGQKLTINAYYLNATDTLHFNGSAETSGKFALTGGAGDDILIGGGGNDVLTGNAGNDALTGNGGVDTLIGRDGNDVLHGGDGDDNLYPGSGSDTVYGDAGNDHFQFGADFDGTDKVDGGTGNDVLHLNGDYRAGVSLAQVVNVESALLSSGHSYALTAGDATVAAGATFTVNAYYFKANDTLHFDGSAETSGKFVLTGGAGGDTLIGGGGNDVLTGNAGSDSLHGGGGNDMLTPGTGSDAVYGDAGDDSFSFGADFDGKDVVDGGTGNDTLYLNGDYAAGVSLGHVTNVETISLNSGHSYAFTATDATVGAGQTLTINTAYFKAASTLTFDGSAERDGRFALTGGAGNDVLKGGAGNDALNGGAGDDVLKGGGGGDVLWGGAGSDTLVYGAASDSTGSHYDTVRWFDFAEDKFDLPSQITGIDAKITKGSLSTASFDHDMQAAADAAHLGAHHAAFFQVSGGSLNGHIFLVADINGVAGYQGGADIAIDLDQPQHGASLGVSDFI